MTDKAKKTLHCYGFLTIVSLLMFLTLFLLSFFSQKTTSESIKKLIQELLDTKYTNQFTVTNNVEISMSSINTSFAYEITDQKSNNEVVVAIKITTLSGPVVGVFKSYNSVSDFEYIGNIGIKDDKTFSSVWNKIPSKQLKYYSDQLKKSFEVRNEH